MDEKKDRELLADRAIRTHGDFNNALLMVSSIVAGIKLASPACPKVWMWYVLALLASFLAQHYFVKTCLYSADHIDVKHGFWARFLMGMHRNQWKFITPVELGLVGWFVWLCLGS